MNCLLDPAREPSWNELRAQVASPLWDALCAELSEAFGVRPLLQYSRCSLAPGWNVKYRKSGRALCTLYPRPGGFSCMVCVGSREAPAAETFLACSDGPARELYRNAAPLNGTRWLMLEIDGEPALRDALELIRLRVPAGRKASRAGCSSAPAG